MTLCGNAIVLQHFENIASVLGNGNLAGVMNSIQTCLLGINYGPIQSGACFGCTAGFSLEVFQAVVGSHQVFLSRLPVTSMTSNFSNFTKL